MSKTFSTPALILKRSNVGETDRIVTLLTKDRGKIAVIAKGCRKLSSSKRGYLEPGNLIEAYLVVTKSLPILTQARIEHEFPNIKLNLQGMKKLLQVLEVVDRLMIEDTVGAEEIFAQVLRILHQLEFNPNQYTQIKHQLYFLVSQLGYDNPANVQYHSLSELVASVSDKPLKSYEYLTVKR